MELNPAIQLGTESKIASPNQTQEIIETIHRDGFACLGKLLTDDEVVELRDGIDRAFGDPRFKSNVYNDFIAVRLFETGRIFEKLLTREPIIGLVEAVLGDDCHIIAENTLRNTREHRMGDFHVDDLLIFPASEGMERHDPKLRMPIHLLAAQVMLTDVEAPEFGPAQYVPGSHCSGRHPNHLTEPNWLGREPETMLCKAGTVTLHNGQCWHRGMPNQSDRTRYLFQLSYARRWVSQRFHPFVNYQLPEHVLERADERTKRVLGVHPPGDYG